MLDFIFNVWTPAAVITKLIWLGQIALAVHVFRTGRSWWWLLALFIAPVLGGLVYFAVEIVPDLRAPQNLTGWRPRPLQISAARARVAESGTVKARLELVALLRAAGRLDEARTEAEACLQGVFRNDPTVLAEVARCRIDAGDAAGALAALDQADVQADRLLAAKVQLLRGRALLVEGKYDEALGCLQRAQEESAAGDEPRYYQALALHQAGRTAEAREVWQDMRRHFRRASGAWARTERRWFALAGQRLRETRDRA